MLLWSPNLPSFSICPTCNPLNSFPHYAQKITKPAQSYSNFHSLASPTSTHAKMPLTGHCLCKAVTFSADVEKPDVVGYDHCDACQRQSGSTYSLVAVVPKAKVTFNGPIKSYAGKGDSGKAVHRLFCSECGSPIAHDPDAAPEIIALKAGCFDKEIKKTLQPGAEIYTQDKLPFCQEKLAHAFEGMPPS